MPNTSKIKSGWSSAPDPTGGAYDARPLKKFVQAGTLDVMDEIEANELILEFVIIKDHHDAIFCVKSKFDRHFCEIVFQIQIITPRFSFFWSFLLSDLF